MKTKSATFYSLILFLNFGIYYKEKKLSEGFFNPHLSLNKFKQNIIYRRVENNRNKTNKYTNHVYHTHVSVIIAILADTASESCMILL